MTGDPKNAAAAAVRGGGADYFCSASCRDKIRIAAGKIGFNFWRDNA
jgi:YHS domain-containing protein